MSHEVAFLDLRATYLEIKDELAAAYQRVMSSRWYILGEDAKAFEQEFAACCRTKHCVGVGNGLEALQLVLRAYGIGPGDEVIVPANMYIVQEKLHQSTVALVSHDGGQQMIRELG